MSFAPRQPRTQGIMSRSNQWINPKIVAAGGMRSDTLDNMQAIAQPRFTAMGIAPPGMFMNAIRNAGRSGMAITPGTATGAGLSQTLRSRLATTTPTKPTFRVHFTKLASTVSDDDVKELCSSVEAYISSRLMRASEAEAFYSSSKAAQEVVALYNGRMLDGVAMDVRLENDASNGSRQALAPVSKMAMKQPASGRNRGGQDEEMEVDRDLITAALFAKKDDKIAFTVKI